MATWLITGCWAGLGRALATAVLDRGETVVVTARDAAGAGELARAYPGTALAMPLDVTGHAQIRDAAGAAHERFGAIDVLVNNAGHGYRAAAEEAADDQAWELFAISFFGPAALIQAVLPGMRERQFRTNYKRSPAAGGDQRLRQHRGRPPQGRPHPGRPPTRPGQPRRSSSPSTVPARRRCSSSGPMRSRGCAIS